MAGICDIPIISNVCDVAGDTVASVVIAPFEWMAEAMGGTAKWMFEGIWELFHTTTLVDITSDEYLGVYNMVFGIAVLLTFAFFCLQLIGGLIRREPGALGRAATGMAKSILGAFILVTITATLLEITDQLSLGLINASGNTIEEMGDRIAGLVVGLSVASISAPGIGILVTIFLGFLAICGALIVWFSLLIRKALLLVLVVLGPIALAGAGWDVTRGWFAKWASFVIALIVSKLIVVLVFLVAITQVSAPIDMDLASIADPIAGVVLMLVAGFAPYLAFKLLAFAGADMYHLSSTEQEAKQAVNRPLPVPHAPKGDGPKKVFDGDEDGGGKGKGSKAPAQASPKPTGGEGSEAGAGSGAGAGAGGGSGGAAAGGGGAAAGAGAGAAAGVVVVTETARAGKETGETVGAAAEEQGGQASESDGASAPPSSTPQSPPPTSPPQTPQQDQQTPRQNPPEPPPTR
ncbi:conjugal transfer protein TrbL [Brevibacterium casei]|uniref:conjugal transfer protein TrbL n=1 Tax=Brevibacterium casei TaxID=33889 RepID=UPI00191AD86B|nr:conjugal transfer protein TrbL [Brevibacterium casei]QQT68744.1 conjugal transfer protein TrbL [Brevibacterium casei]